MAEEEEDEDGRSALLGEVGVHLLALLVAVLWFLVHTEVAEYRVAGVHSHE